MKDTMAKALAAKPAKEPDVFVNGVRVVCTSCASAVRSLQMAGGMVLRWKCDHQPRIILSTPFDIKTCTVVWEKVVA